MMTDKYAVFGNPIAHSLSPFIHKAFAEQTKQDIEYHAILAPVDKFSASLQSFIDKGGRGANITVPFKIEAYELCDELSETAKLAGAVNTISVLPTGKIKGDNTDGAGLVADLLDSLDLTNKRVLLIGAGGAARGCVLPLINAKIANLTICNRTSSKAKTLADLFADYGSVNSLPIESINAEYDVIINSTSAGLAGELPEISASVVGKDTLCYDMLYGNNITPFNLWASNLGAWKVMDGLGMLIGQAAKSFEIWRGVKPETKEVKNRLLEHLKFEHTKSNESRI